MYYIQDAHSFWDWIYFVLLIVVSILKLYDREYFFEIIHFTDWILLHDQPLPRRNRNAIFRNQETRDGTYASGKGSIHFDVYLGIQYEQFRADNVLCRDCQIHWAPVPKIKTPNH